ncbi:sigma-54-dependent transcriptional regulator [Nitrospina watsonii]|uniref:Regulatory protein AtoC n=1 Tax=Nitrospina watsonii TaxID=1323948 RepID=A0ABN8VZL7_9BACT|nr:sigma-54 dependent transcriptional regulator [Nitrospina watsonii]CAI2719227.1 Regulatory protein AtoC [Nitrospina watsonii]
MKSQRRILIVDDEADMRAALTAALKREGHTLKTAENGKDALALVEIEDFDLVISDVKMPKMTGAELLKAVKELKPETRIIMMTAYGTIDNAVESMKQGAFDYLLKPFSADILVSTVTRALQTESAPGATQGDAGAAADDAEAIDPRQIVTQNKTMQELLTFAGNVAYSQSTVLISGETGTGKELFARYIHQCSPRAGKPFLAVNCAALPEGLLESELFGHEKGSFTGAITAKQGKFELAHGGTLLLDEVTEMTLPLQAKLLRVLQEHEVDKVGGKEPIPVNVRVIATTNRDPKALIAEQKFREDLYYRLNVIPLKLPPLRERKEDIPVLADHFAKKHGQRNNKTIVGVADETKKLLQKYQWQGNVREFENIMERAVLLCHADTIQPSNLFMDDDAATAAQPASANGSSPLGEFRGTLHEMERELILRTLEETEGNKTKAAEQLGISIRTLRNKLSEYKEKA